MRFAMTRTYFVARFIGVLQTLPMDDDFVRDTH